MFAVAALAACTTEQTIVAPQNEAIGFDTFVDNSTRATDITTANIADFGVYGTVTKGGNSALIFDNTKVTKSGDAFVYSPAQYWIAAAKYDFLAFAPYQDGEGATWSYDPTEGTFSFNNATAEADQDVVYAYQAKTTADKLTAKPEAVKFTFKHILSKVAFSFTNTFTDGNTTLSVYNVKINNTAETGTMAIADDGVDAAWNGVGDLVVPFGAKTADATTALANGAELKLAHHYVIPAQRVYNITFSVDLYQAGVYLATYNHEITPTINFAKNGNYVLSVKLAPESIDPKNELYPIEFTVNDVEDWRDNGSVALTEPVEVSTADALKAAIAEGKSVKLTADIALAEPLQITKNANAIVDLNGKTITAALKQEGRHHYAIDNYGTLTLAGEGAINARGIENFGTMTINGNITITNVDTNGGSTIWNEGNLVINGGTFTTNAQAGAGSYGGALYTEEGHRAVINGGTFIANSQLTYAICNYGETIINDAVVKGKHGAVAADSGAVTVIKGGSFELMENLGVSDHCAYYVSEIKGGKFTLGKNTDSGAQVFYESTIAEGYTVEQNGDWYIVK